MSKIAEQKALEKYPKDSAYTKCDEDETNYSEIDADGIKWLKVDINKTNRDCYIKGYDQALRDVEKQVEDSVIEKSNGEVTIEDLVAYNQGFKIGRELTMQDFLEKAERYLKNTIYDRVEVEVHGTLIPSIVSKKEFIDNFKNYIENES